MVHKKCNTKHQFDIDIKDEKMETKIGAALLSLAGQSLSSEEKFLFREINPLGFCFFNRNIENQNQIYRLTQEISSLLGRDDVIFAVDQEGGRVQRLHEPEFLPYASQQTIGRLYTEISPEAARKAAQYHAALISQDLRKCGLNMNLAPVLDIGHKTTTAAVSSRCFSSSAEITAELGQIMVNEYTKQGIISCVKHLPGHGRASVDPHLDLPVIKEDMSKLEEDFFPFKELKNTPCGMTAHIVLQEIDKSHPITQSPIGIKELIRKTIGFKGFLFSDSIEMHALKEDLATRGQKSLKAGCDAYCYSRGNTEELKKLCPSLPPLKRESITRFSEMKKILKITPKKTEKNIRQSYEQLLNGITPYQENYDSTLVLMEMQNK